MQRYRTYTLLFTLLYLVTLLLCWFQPPWIVDLRNFVFDSYQRLDPAPYDPAESGPHRGDR